MPCMWRTTRVSPMANAMHVENYPGFPNGISGFDLGELMHQQATRYDLETRTAKTSGIKPGDSDILIKTNEGDFTAKAVIVAGGHRRRRPV